MTNTPQNTWNRGTGALNPLQGAHLEGSTGSSRPTPEGGTLELPTTVEHTLDWDCLGVELVNPLNKGGGEGEEHVSVLAARGTAEPAEVAVEPASRAPVVASRRDESATYERGEYRLHGPPGCGKTHALTTKWVPRALARSRPLGRPVLVASLTKTAATEIAGRLGDDPLVQARTLHSHAFRQLEGPRVVDRSFLDAWNEQHPYWRVLKTIQAPDDQDDSGMGKEGPGDQLLAEYDLCRHRMEGLSERCRGFAAAWRQALDEAGAVDFTGMIERALAQARERLAHDAPGHSADPGVLIVDEAQDCSRLEQELVRAWGAKAAFFVMAGDADQAIYTWRGASPETFLGRELPDGAHYHLEQSYRVPQEVHAVATAWIRRLEDRHVVNYRPRAEAGTVLRSRVHCGWEQGLRGLVESELQATGDGSVMVITPCAYMLEATLKALRSHGIPFHNPYRPKAARWNPMAILARAEEFLSGLPMWAEDLRQKPRWWTVAQLARWVRPLSSEAFPRGLKARVEKLYKATEAEERSRRVTLAELHELWGGALAWTAFEADVVDDPVKWLAAATLGTEAASLPYALRALERLAPGMSVTEALIRAPRPRVVVGTIHSVKGGEADSVVLAPDLSRAQQESQERDSVTRLMYVGLTRSRSRLVLMDAHKPGAVRWPA